MQKYIYNKAVSCKLGGPCERWASWTCSLRRLCSRRSSVLFSCMPLSAQGHLPCGHYLYHPAQLQQDGYPGTCPFYLQPNLGRFTPNGSMNMVCQRFTSPNLFDMFQQVLLLTCAYMGNIQYYYLPLTIAPRSLRNGLTYIRTGPHLR